MFNAHKFLITTILIFVFTDTVGAESLRVSPEWLNNHLQDSNLVILDARSADLFKLNHIVGAVNFPDTLTYQHKTTNGQIVETDIMQSLLRKKGINENNLLVIYDSGQLLDAIRVFWALEVYGLSNVRVLSSGFDYWIEKKYPITNEKSFRPASSYIARINHNRISSKFSTQLATVNPQQIIMDARDPDSFSGKKSSAKRFGHIPSAINIPVSKNIDNVDGIKSLHNLAKLKSIYSKLDKGKKVITYCNIGRISSTNYFALRELGYDVSNYDASWKEWGNDNSLPIEK